MGAKDDLKIKLQVRGGYTSKNNTRQLLIRITLKRESGIKTERADIYTKYYVKVRKENNPKTGKQEWVPIISHFKNGSVNPGHPDYNDIIDYLADFKAKARNIFRDVRYYKENITVEELKSRILQVQPKTVSFKDTFDHFVNVMKADKAPRTITNYKTVFKFLEDFSRAKNIKLAFNSIDIDFFESLKDYSYNSRGIETNYFAKIIGVLKAFLRWSYERYHNRNDFLAFKAPEVEKEVIYLTWDELMTLYNYNFKIPDQRIARELFCFMCFTGLRVGDLRMLTPDHIKAKRIEIIAQKTGDKLYIPLSSYAIEILKRNKGILPKMLQQKININIKDCCKVAGITEKTRHHSHVGGKIDILYSPKYELICNHTARRTFITISIEKGMSPKTIMKIVGHKKDSTMNRYLKIADKFAEIEMEKWEH